MSSGIPSSSFGEDNDSSCSSTSACNCFSGDGVGGIIVFPTFDDDDNGGGVVVEDKKFLNMMVAMSYLSYLFEYIYVLFLEFEFD